MTIPMGTVSLSCTDLGAECEPFNAIVESCEDERTVVVVERVTSLKFKIGTECEVRYTDPKDGRFMAVSSIVESINREQMSLRITTESRSANQRSAFRVSTSCSDITARIGTFTECKVMDVSAAGIRVKTPEALRVGAAINVQISTQGEQFKGKFIVRRVGECEAGIHIGLSAAPDDKQLISSLTQLTSSVQRDQLRRKSRVNHGDTATEAPESQCPDDQRDSHTDQASVHAEDAEANSEIDLDRSQGATRGEVLSMDEFKSLESDGMCPAEDSLNDPDDRRANQRMECTGEVRVTALQGKQVVQMRADLLDISRGGLGLRAPTVLKPDDYMVIEFSSPEGNCWVFGRVVHEHVGEGEISCRLGIQFQLNEVQRGQVPISVPEFAQLISIKREQDTHRSHKD